MTNNKNIIRGGDWRKARSKEKAKNVTLGSAEAIREREYTRVMNRKAKAQALKKAKGKPTRKVQEDLEDHN